MIVGLTEILTIIKDLDNKNNNNAIMVVDSNHHIEKILPSERVLAYKLKYDALKHQGKRNDVTFDAVEGGSQNQEKFWTNKWESKTQISRYIRLKELDYKLLDMADAKIIPFNVYMQQTD